MLANTLRLLLPHHQYGVHCVKCSSFHTHFLDHFQSVNRRLHFQILVSVNCMRLCTHNYKRLVRSMQFWTHLLCPAERSIPVLVSVCGYATPIGGWMDKHGHEPRLLRDFAHYHISSFCVVVYKKIYHH